MVAWSDSLQPRERASRVIRLASHDPAHVRYSNAHGKKTVYTRNSPLIYPAIGAPMGGLRNANHAHRWSPWQMLVVGWANMGELGCGVSKPWLSIWKSLLETAEETSFQITDRCIISI